MSSDPEYHMYSSQNINNPKEGFIIKAKDTNF